MLNFAVGPVMSSKEVLDLGAEQVPYFRTSEFSEIMFENEALILKYAHAPSLSRAAFLTGSGSAAMEAAIINTLTVSDRAIIVNGGSFGQRFVNICECHHIPYTQIKLETGHSLKASDLEAIDASAYTAFIVNMHETSTGVLYDMKMIGDYCKKNNLFLIVDTVSAFLADDFNMAELGVNIMLTASQKALACPPGISIIVSDETALNRIQKAPVVCMYLDLKDAYKNALRGQTPYTPAVGTLLQIHKRLQMIEADGGVEAQVLRVHAQAMDFRQKIKELPFEIISDSLSNAVTPLHPLTASANDIFNILKDEYGIWICPNGGALKDTVFRVGHIGNLSFDDNTVLVNAFYDLKNRGII